MLYLWWAQISEEVSINASDGLLLIYPSAIEKISSSQKQATKAWAEFAKDVSSYMEESRLWRISIEEKIGRLLERPYGNETSDLGFST